MKMNNNIELAVVASQWLEVAFHDTTPLSRFVIPNDFKVLLKHLPFVPSHLL